MAQNEELETTLDLDQVMREGMEKFTGEPDAPDVPADDDSITPPETETDSPSEDPEDGERPTDDKSQRADDGRRTTEDDPSETADALDQENAEDADANDAAQEKPAETTAETDHPKSLRFKSHQEAEKGYRHLQGEMTRAAQRARELEKELQALKQAEAKKAAQGKAEQAFVDFAADRRKQAMEQVEALSDEDPEYTVKASRIWAEADRDIHRFDWSQFQQAEDGGQPAAGESQAPQPDPADLQQQAVKTAETMAADAGLTHEADLTTFRMVAGRTPEVDEQGQPMSFEDQVQWAITETRQLIEAQQARFLADQKQKAGKKNDARLAAETPMGRTAAAPRPARDDATPVTLDDALKKAFDERRL